MTLFLRAPAFVLLPLLLLVGCSEPPAPSEETGLLQHVPADTPFVFVSRRRLPEELAERMADHAARQLSVQRASLIQARTQLLEADEQGEMPPELQRGFEVADALLAEFEGRETAAELRVLGIEPVPLAVYYGIGLLPAARVEIADAAAVDALIDRVEQRTGIAAARGVSAGQAYRRIDLGQIDAVLAVTPEHLVVGLLPDTLFERDLPLLLGQRAPDRSLAADEVIADIAERHGFEGYGEGFIRLDQVLDALLGRAAGRDAEVMRALGAEAVPLSPGCLRLLQGMVAGMPRMVVGISEAQADRLAVRGIWESSSEVTDYLRRLAAPVPGLGAEYHGLVSVGVGVDLPQLRNGIEALLRELIAQGRECEWVEPAKLEAAIPQLSLVLGPMTAGLKGFNLQVADVEIDPATLAPKTVEASLLAAVDDPRGVFALGAMLNPALGAIEVPNDGTPVDLPNELVLDRPTPPVKVAIKGKALLLMAGEASAANSAALFAAATVEPSPLFAIDYGVRQLVGLFGDVLEHASARLASEGEVELAAQLSDQFADLRLQAEIFERLRVALYASEQGLVMDQVMQLR